MNPERRQKINRFIAEKCGWTNIHAFNKHKEGGPSTTRDGDIVGDLNGITRRHIPDYTADLNAVISATTKSLRTIHEQDQFSFEIWKLLRLARRSSPSEVRSVDFLVVNATAAQRAEALYRVLGGEE